MLYFELLFCSRPRALAARVYYVKLLTTSNKDYLSIYRLASTNSTKVVLCTCFSVIKCKRKECPDWSVFPRDLTLMPDQRPLACPPTLHYIKIGDKVAQLVRYRTSNQRVAGSIPGRGTLVCLWARQFIPYCFSLPSCKMCT